LLSRELLLLVILYDRFDEAPFAEADPVDSPWILIDLVNIGIEKYPSINCSAAERGFFYILDDLQRYSASTMSSS
jgi:hypothetical protein